MRRMSFNMTQQAMRDRRKTVTRRLGWKFLKPGDRLLAVDRIRVPKDQAEVFGVIEIVDVRTEPLERMIIEQRAYGEPECILEGFPPGMPDLPLGYGALDFVSDFCRANGCAPDQIVRRIEFRFVEDSEVQP